MSALDEAIACAVRGEEVPATQLAQAFETVMDGAATPVQMAALLVALRSKGESPAELAAVARTLRARAVSAPLPHPMTLDTCGTGGDGAGTFNISTTAAFVVAGAGVPVAKHGNRAASSKTGSADVLEALGAAIEIPVAAAAQILGEVGIAFFFAREAHPAMRHLAPVRAELGIRTLMNCLGPLLNPVGARRQIIGVYDRALLAPLAAVLRELGSVSAWLVHGDDGLDELSTTTTSQVTELREGRIKRFELDPAKLGIAKARLDDLAGGDAETNAEILRAVLAGAPGPQADVVLLNAGAGLLVAGVAKDLSDGIARARASIASGAAAAKLSALVQASRKRAAT